jgi:Ca-activated chloride channel family protein
LALSAIGQQPAAGQFASGVSLVEVYATVTDARGEPVSGLQRSDFVVEEDGAAQELQTFTAGEFPLSLAIAVDRSFSMPPATLGAARSAASRFVSELRPDDQVMVIGIGSEVETLAPLSTDRAAARDALMRLDKWGTTPLYDATASAIDVIQAARGRRALILLSDGNDRYSETKPADLVGRARQKDVLVYPIALGRQRPDVFAELATVTGGRSFQATDERALTTTLGAIARELRFQYLLGYAPSRPAGDRPEWRSIRVSVKRPELRVRARDGYLSR